jgi:hypothetical protein
VDAPEDKGMRLPEPPRPLTAGEAEIIQTLLQYEDFSGRDELLDQVSTAQVIGRCGCGCATVELEDGPTPASDSIPQPIPTEATILDESGDGIGGMLLFVNDGRLSELEVYSFGEHPIRTMPPVDRLSIR